MVLAIKSQLFETVNVKSFLDPRRTLDTSRYGMRNLPSALLRRQPYAAEHHDELGTVLQRRAGRCDAPRRAP